MELRHGLLARYPQTWMRPFDALADDKKVPSPEEVAAAFEHELGASLERLEAEWREWAGGNSPIAKAHVAANDSAGRSKLRTPDASLAIGAVDAPDGERQHVQTLRADPAAA